MKDIPMRDGYGKAILALSRAHSDIMVLDADVAKSTRTEWVKTKILHVFWTVVFRSRIWSAQPGV